MTKKDQQQKTKMGESNNAHLVSICIVPTFLFVSWHCNNLTHFRDSIFCSKCKPTLKDFQALSDIIFFIVHSGKLRVQAFIDLFYVSPSFFNKVGMTNDNFLS